MSNLTRISITLSQSALAASVTSPVSCIRPDGNGTFDYLALELGSFVGFGGTTTFVGSLTNKNTSFSVVGSPVPGAAFSPVVGYNTSDPARALVSNVVAPNGLYIIPVTFLYFYPVCSAYSGSGGFAADIFGF